MSDKYGNYSNELTRVDSDYNLAYGTAERMNLSLWKINNSFRENDYKNMFREEQILFDEISTFVCEIKKEDASIDTRKEFEEAKKIEDNCKDKLKLCWKEQDDGSILLEPSDEMVNSLREYQRYLRALMFKYKLYIKVKDMTLAAAKVG